MFIHVEIYTYAWLSFFLSETFTSDNNLLKSTANKLKPI